MDEIDKIDENNNDSKLSNELLEENKLYIPLKFWFNRNTGLAIPLIGLGGYRDIEELYKLIYINDDSLYNMKPCNNLIYSYKKWHRDSNNKYVERNCHHYHNISNSIIVRCDKHEYINIIPIKSYKRWNDCSILECPYCLVDGNYINDIDDLDDLDDSDNLDDIDDLDDIDNLDDSDDIDNLDDSDDLDDLDDLETINIGIKNNVGSSNNNITYTIDY